MTMPDISIFNRAINGQRRYLLIGETEKGKRFLKENFITTSELVSIQCDPPELEEIVVHIQDEDLTVDNH